MFQPRALPSNTSNTIEFELWEGLLHITAIRLTPREAASIAVSFVSRLLASSTRLTLFFRRQVLGAFGVISCAIVSSLLFYLLSHVVYVGHGARKERSESLKRFLSTDSELASSPILSSLPLSVSDSRGD